MTGTGIELAASGFILAVLQGVKGFIPESWKDRVLPSLTLALGIVYVTLLDPQEGMTLGESLLKGVQIGAVAAGGFAMAKKAGESILSAAKKK